MSISDIQNELENIKNSVCTPQNNNNNVNTSNKPNKQSLLEDFINNKVINIYCFPWKKLDYKLKERKINEYVNNNKDITKKDYYKNVLCKLVKNKNKLNIDYDETIGVIKNIDYEFN